MSYKRVLLNEYPTAEFRHPHFEMRCIGLMVKFPATLLIGLFDFSQVDILRYEVDILSVIQIRQPWSEQASKLDAQNQNGTAPDP